MKRFLITVACALLAAPAMAQEDALKDLPGYVDFGISIGWSTDLIYLSIPEDRNSDLACGTLSPRLLRAKPSFLVWGSGCMRGRLGRPPKADGSVGGLSLRFSHSCTLPISWARLRLRLKRWPS